MNKCYIFITDNKTKKLHVPTYFYFAFKLKYKLIIYVFLLLKLLAELATIETAFIFTYVAWRTFLTNASKMPSLKLVQQFVESWNCKFFCPPPPSLYWAVENRISNPKRNVYLLRIKPIYEYQHDLSSLMKAVIVKSVNELFFWANVCFLIAKTRQKSPNCPSYCWIHCTPRFFF